jgi:hypothetical protein
VEQRLEVDCLGAGAIAQTSVWSSTLVAGGTTRSKAGTQLVSASRIPKDTDAAKPSDPRPTQVGSDGRSPNLARPERAATGAATNLGGSTTRSGGNLGTRERQHGTQVGSSEQIRPVAATRTGAIRANSRGLRPPTGCRRGDCAQLFGAASETRRGQTFAISRRHHEGLGPNDGGESHLKASADRGNTQHSVARPEKHHHFGGDEKGSSSRHFGVGWFSWPRTLRRTRQRGAAGLAHRLGGGSSQRK